jgi:cytochrome c biogenesis protein CcdA
MRKLRSELLLFLLIAAFIFIPSYAFADTQVNVWFFYTSTCPHCHKVLSSGVLEQLPSYARVEYFEISENESAGELFMRITKYYNVPALVPTAVIFTDDPYSGKVIQGDDPIINNIAPEVERAISSLSQKSGMDSSQQTSFKEKLENNHLLLVLATAAADSVNPCIMAVLVLMLATLSLVAQKQGKRATKRNMNRQMVKVGAVYTAVVFTSYLIIGLLLVGGAMLIFNKLAIHSSKIAFYIKLFVAVLVGAAGIINIKDFFWYGKGVSFILPKKYVTRIKSLTRKASLPAIVSAALIVTIVEFPCSGMMYLGLITYFVASSVEFITLMLYLLLYNIVFILPLVIITVLATKSLSRVEETRLKYRKVFRLVMGVALVILAAIIMLA